MSTTSMLLRRFRREDEGQDLIEYALLVLFIVLATVAVWELIVSAMGIAYRGYDSSLWDLFWEPPGA